MRTGGRYEKDPKTGERTLVEEPTKPAPASVPGEPAEPSAAVDADSTESE